MDKAEAEAEREKGDLRRIIFDLNEQIKILEEKLKKALEEGKRLRLHNEERKREIDGLKVQFNQEDNELFTKEELRRRELEMKELMNEHENQIGEMDSQLAELKTTLENRSNDCQRLTQLLAERKRENDDLRAMVRLSQFNCDDNDKSFLNSLRKERETLLKEETWRRNSF